MRLSLIATTVKRSKTAKLQSVTSVRPEATTSRGPKSLWYSVTEPLVVIYCVWSLKTTLTDIGCSTTVSPAMIKDPLIVCVKRMPIMIRM